MARRITVKPSLPVAETPANPVEGAGPLKQTPPKKRPGRKPKALPEYGGPRFDLAPGKCLDIRLDKLCLDDTTFQIRAASRPEALLESIRSHGVLDPLVARKHPEHPGEYQLVSGFNRAEAARRIGLKTVPVIVKDLTDADALLFAYAENDHRQSLTDLDRACAIRKLRESGAARTTAEVAGLFRLSERQVQRLEALLTYPRSLQQAVATGRISATHALVLNQAHLKRDGKVELGRWITRVKDEALSVEDLRDALRRAFRSPGAKKQLLRKSGSLLIINRKYLADASAELRQKAALELKKVLVELSS